MCVQNVRNSERLNAWNIPEATGSIWNEGHWSRNQKTRVLFLGLAQHRSMTLGQSLAFLRLPVLIY